MTRIRLDRYTITDITSTADPNDSWDRDDLIHHTYVEGFQKVPEKERYFDLTIPFEPQPNTPYYLLRVVYTTGDSFHIEEGVCEFIGLYESDILAIENEDRIWKHSKKTWDQDKYVQDKEGAYSIELLNSNKEPYFSGVPWAGYFESLENTHISTIYLQPEKGT